MRHRPLASTLLSLLACACANGSSSGSATVSFNPTLYLGTWSGTWTNTSTSASGTADVTVTQDGTTLTIAVDLGGAIFGTTDPDVETFTAHIEPARATMTPASSDLLGDLTGSIADSATVTVVGRNLDGGAATFTLVGGATSLQVALNVTITNDDDTTETANAVLYKM